MDLQGFTTIDEVGDDEDPNDLEVRKIYNSRNMFSPNTAAEEIDYLNKIICDLEKNNKKNENCKSSSCHDTETGSMIQSGDRVCSLPEFHNKNISSINLLNSLRINSNLLHDNLQLESVSNEKEPSLNNYGAISDCVEKDSVCLTEKKPHSKYEGISFMYNNVYENIKPVENQSDLLSMQNCKSTESNDCSSASSSQEHQHISCIEIANFNSKKEFSVNENINAIDITKDQTCSRPVSSRDNTSLPPLNVTSIKDEPMEDELNEEVDVSEYFNDSTEVCNLESIKQEFPIERYMTGVNSSGNGSHGLKKLEPPSLDDFILSFIPQVHFRVKKKKLYSKEQLTAAAIMAQFSLASVINMDMFKNLAKTMPRIKLVKLEYLLSSEISFENRQLVDLFFVKYGRNPKKWKKYFKARKLKKLERDRGGVGKHTGKAFVKKHSRVCLSNENQGINRVKILKEKYREAMSKTYIKSKLFHASDSNTYDLDTKLSQSSSSGGFQTHTLQGLKLKPTNEAKKLNDNVISDRDCVNDTVGRMACHVGHSGSEVYKTNNLVAKTNSRKPHVDKNGKSLYESDSNRLPKKSHKAESLKGLNTITSSCNEGNTKTKFSKLKKKYEKGISTCEINLNRSNSKEITSRVQNEVPSGIKFLKNKYKIKSCSILLDRLSQKLLESSLKATDMDRLENCNELSNNSSMHEKPVARKVIIRRGNSYVENKFSSKCLENQSFHEIPDDSFEDILQENMNVDASNNLIAKPPTEVNKVKTIPEDVHYDSPESHNKRDKALQNTSDATVSSSTNRIIKSLELMKSKDVCDIEKQECPVNEIIDHNLPNDTENNFHVKKNICEVDFENHLESNSKTSSSIVAFMASADPQLTGDSLLKPKQQSVQSLDKESEHSIPNFENLKVINGTNDVLCNQRVMENGLSDHTRDDIDKNKEQIDEKLESSNMESIVVPETPCVDKSVQKLKEHESPDSSFKILSTNTFKSFEFDEAEEKFMNAQSHAPKKREENDELPSEENKNKTFSVSCEGVSLLPFQLPSDSFQSLKSSGIEKDDVMKMDGKEKKVDSQDLEPHLNVKKNKVNVEHFDSKLKNINESEEIHCINGHKFPLKNCWVEVEDLYYNKLYRKKIKKEKKYWIKRSNEKERLQKKRSEKKNLNLESEKFDIKSKTEIESTIQNERSNECIVKTVDSASSIKTEIKSKKKPHWTEVPLFGSSFRIPKKISKNEFESKPKSLINRNESESILWPGYNKSKQKYGQNKNMSKANVNISNENDLSNKKSFGDEDRKPKILLNFNPDLMLKNKNKSLSQINTESLGLKATLVPKYDRFKLNSKTDYICSPSSAGDLQSGGNNSAVDSTNSNKFYLDSKEHSHKVENHKENISSNFTVKGDEASIEVESLHSPKYKCKDNCRLSCEENILVDQEAILKVLNYENEARDSLVSPLAEGNDNPQSSPNDDGDSTVLSQDITIPKIENVKNLGATFKNSNEDDKKHETKPINVNIDQSLNSSPNASSEKIETESHEFLNLKKIESLDKKGKIQLYLKYKKNYNIAKKKFHEQPGDTLESFVKKKKYKELKFRRKLYYDLKVYLYEQKKQRNSKKNLEQEASKKKKQQVEDITEMLNELDEPYSPSTSPLILEKVNSPGKSTSLQDTKYRCQKESKLLNEDEMPYSPSSTPTITETATDSNTNNVNKNTNLDHRISGILNKPSSISNPQNFSYNINKITCQKEIVTQSMEGIKDGAYVVESYSDGTENEDLPSMLMQSCENNSESHSPILPGNLNSSYFTNISELSEVLQNLSKNPCDEFPIKDNEKELNINSLEGTYDTSFTCRKTDLISVIQNINSKTSNPSLSVKEDDLLQNLKHNSENESKDAEYESNVFENYKINDDESMMKLFIGETKAKNFIRKGPCNPSHIMSQQSMPNTNIYKSENSCNLYSAVNMQSIYSPQIIVNTTTPLCDAPASCREVALSEASDQTKFWHDNAQRASEKNMFGVVQENSGSSTMSETSKGQVGLSLATALLLPPPPPPPTAESSSEMLLQLENPSKEKKSSFASIITEFFDNWKDPSENIERTTKSSFASHQGATGMQTDLGEDEDTLMDGKFYEKTPFAQPLIDKVQGIPLVGLHFILEIQQGGASSVENCSYICCLCSKKMSSTTLIAHIKSVPHRLKFTESFCANLHSKFGKMEVKQWTAALVKEFTSSLLEYEKDVGRQKLAVTTEMKMNAGVNFLKNKLLSSKKSKKIGQEDSELKTKTLSRGNDSAISNVASSPNYLQKDKQMKRMYDNNEKSLLKTSKSAKFDPDSRSYDHKRSRSRDKSREKERSRDRLKDRIWDEDKDSHSKSRRKDSPSRRRSLSPLHQSKQKKTRSRSPHRFHRKDWESSKRDRSPIYNRKIKSFRADEEQIRNEYIKLVDQYLKSPESHPCYKLEWEKFWDRRYREVKKEGLDISHFDFKSEWLIFWPRRLKELCSLEYKNRRDELLSRYKMSNPDTERDSKLYYSEKDSDKIVPQPGKCEMTASGFIPSSTMQESSKNGKYKNTAFACENSSLEGPYEVGFSVVGTLKLLIDLEDHLGSLFPGLQILLNDAIDISKSGGQSIKLFETNDNLVLLRLASVKLSSQISSGILDVMTAAKTQRAIESINWIMNEAEKFSPPRQANRISELGLDLNVLSTATVGMNTMQIAQYIAQQLFNIGKSDVDEAVLQDILMAISERHIKYKMQNKNDSQIYTSSGCMLNESSNKSTNPRMCGDEYLETPAMQTQSEVTFPKQAAPNSEESKFSSGPALFPSGATTTKTLKLNLDTTAAAVDEAHDSESSDKARNSALSLLQTAYDNEEEILKDRKDMDSLSLEELKELLSNFKKLTSQEQQSLTSYLKKLEATDNKKVTKLRSMMQNAKPIIQRIQSEKKASASKPSESVDIENRINVDVKSTQKEWPNLKQTVSTEGDTNFGYPIQYSSKINFEPKLTSSEPKDDNVQVNQTPNMLPSFHRKCSDNNESPGFPYRQPLLTDPQHPPNCDAEKTLGIRSGSDHDTDELVSRQPKLRDPQSPSFHISHQHFLPDQETESHTQGKRHPLLPDPVNKVFNKESFAYNMKPQAVNIHSQPPNYFLDPHEGNTDQHGERFEVNKSNYDLKIKNPLHRTYESSYSGNRKPLLPDPEAGKGFLSKEYRLCNQSSYGQASYNTNDRVPFASASTSLSEYAAVNPAFFEESQDHDGSTANFSDHFSDNLNPNKNEITYEEPHSLDMHESNFSEEAPSALSERGHYYDSGTPDNFHTDPGFVSKSFRSFAAPVISNDSRKSESLEETNYRESNHGHGQGRGHFHGRGRRPFRGRGRFTSH